DRIDADAGALREPHVDEKDREAVAAPRCRFARGGAGKEQEKIGMLGARRPDLLPVDDVVVALAHGGGWQVERVRTGCRHGAPAARRTRSPAASATSAPRCRAAARCPWCTSGRGRPRRCSPTPGSPP